MALQQDLLLEGMTVRDIELEPAHGEAPQVFPNHLQPALLHFLRIGLALVDVELGRGIFAALGVDPLHELGDV